MVLRARASLSLSFSLSRCWLSIGPATGEIFGCVCVHSRHQREREDDIQNCFFLSHSLSLSAGTKWSCGENIGQPNRSKFSRTCAYSLQMSSFFVDFDPTIVDLEPVELICTSSATYGQITAVEDYDREREGETEAFRKKSDKL